MQQHTAHARMAASCRYYTAEQHRAAFVLPKFARDGLSGSLTF